MDRLAHAEEPTVNTRLEAETAAPEARGEAQAPPGAAGSVCTTVVDELLEAQLARAGQICSTIVDDLLEAQLGEEP